MKAVQVFNLIAKKEVDSYSLGQIIGESGAKVYSVSDKQYVWLVNTLCRDFKNYDGNTAITFSDDSFNYIVDPKKRSCNAPKYIPNNKQYGYTHYIIKQSK